MVLVTTVGESHKFLNKIVLIKKSTFSISTVQSEVISMDSMEVIVTAQIQVMMKIPMRQTRNLPVQIAHFLIQSPTISSIWEIVTTFAKPILMNNWNFTMKAMKVISKMNMNAVI